MATTYLEILAYNEITEPLDINLASETIGITVDTKLIVDTGLDTLQITGLIFPQEISTTQTFIVDTELTELKIENIPDPLDITTTGVINVSTGLTQLEINNYPDKITVINSITEKLPVDTGLTDISLNYVGLPVLDIISTAAIPVDTGLISLNITPPIGTISVTATSGTLPVNTGLTQLAETTWLTEYSVTSTGNIPTTHNHDGNVAILNYDAITAYTLDVDPGEITLNYLTGTDVMPINISQQGGVDLNVQSNNKDIASEDTLLMIKNTTTPTIPLLDSLISKLRCVYCSFGDFNHLDGTQNWNVYDNANTISHSRYGIIITLLTGQDIIYRFGPTIAKGGKTLCIFTHDYFSNSSSHQVAFDFSLESINVNANDRVGLSYETSIANGYLRIVNAGHEETDEFINQAQFNVDKLDGTGPSGLTWDRVNSKYLRVFFLLDNNVKNVYIGFLIGNNYITLHILNTTGNYKNLQPIWTATNSNDTETAMATIKFCGIEIYKDCEDIPSSIHSLYRSNSVAMAINTKKLFAFRMLNGNRKLKIKNFYIYTNRHVVLYIYAYRSNIATWTNSTLLGNLSFDETDNQLYLDQEIIHKSFYDKKKERHINLDFLPEHYFTTYDDPFSLISLHFVIEKRESFTSNQIYWAIDWEDY